MSSKKHDNELAVFDKPEIKIVTQKREWITVRSINQLTEGAAIKFNVPGNSVTYIDLKNPLLTVKLKVIKADGSNLEAGDKVGLKNNALHSIFSQVDVNLQEQSTSKVGANYAYKAYLDTLLQCQSQHDLDCQLLIKDDSGIDNDDTDPTGKNNRLHMRAIYTR